MSRTVPAVSAAVVGFVTVVGAAVPPTSDTGGLEVDENVFVNRRVAGALSRRNQGSASDRTAAQTRQVVPS